MTARSGFLELLLLMAALSPASAKAQAAHYASSTFGSRSALLGGNVIGAAVDLGATYYNPGTLPLIEDVLALDFSLYEYRHVGLSGGEGQRQDLAFETVRPVPSLFALALPRWHDNLFVVSVLTRESDSLRLEARRRRTDLPGFPATEEAVSEFTMDEATNEPWAGLCWSRRVSEHISVGFTPYLALRTQRSRLQVGAFGRSATGEVATFLAEQEFRLRVLRVLARAGVGMRWGPLTAGISGTTASLKLTGSGSYYINRVTTGLDLTGDQRPDPSLESSISADNDADFRSPWSVGVGASYVLGAFTLYASAEWFSGIDRYAVVSVVAPATEIFGPAAFFGKTRSIVDGGAALQWSAGERLSLFVHFALDRSAIPSDAASNVRVVGSWDYWRAGGGAAFRLGRTDLVVGLGYNRGQRRLEHSDDTFLAAALRRTTVRDWAVMLGMGLTVAGDDRSQGEPRTGL